MIVKQLISDFSIKFFSLSTPSLQPLPATSFTMTLEILLNEFHLSSLKNEFPRYGDVL